MRSELSNSKFSLTAKAPNAWTYEVLHFEVFDDKMRLHPQRGHFLLTNRTTKCIVLSQSEVFLVKNIHKLDFWRFTETKSFLSCFDLIMFSNVSVIEVFSHKSLIAPGFRALDTWYPFVKVLQYSATLFLTRSWHFYIFSDYFGPSNWDQ